MSMRIWNRTGSKGPHKKEGSPSGKGREGLPRPAENRTENQTAQTRCEEYSCAGKNRGGKDFPAELPLRL